MTTMEGVEEEEGAFSRSSLLQRTPPSTATRLLPTEGDLDVFHRAAAEGFQPFDTSGNTTGVTLYSPGSSMDLDQSNEGSGGDALDYNLYLPAKYRKKLLKERKVAEGSWISKRQWQRSKGQKPNKRVKAKGSGTVGVGSVDEGSASSRGAPRRASRPAADNTSGVKRPRRWDQQPATAHHSGATEKEGTKRLSFKEQVTSWKMAVVPEAFPEVRLTREDCDMLQEKLVEEVCSEEGASAPLQILATYFEKGALIVTCGNEDTRLWLRTKGPGLGTVGDGGAGLIVGDYKDLLRSTKALLRTDKFLAKKDPAFVLNQVEKQNPGLSTKDWRIIGVKKEEGNQTLVLSIDELSSQILKSRDWRVFLGITRVQLRVLSSVPEDDKDPSG